MVMNFLTTIQNICVDSKIVNGAENFLNGVKKKISLGVCTNKQDYLSVIY